MIRAGVALAALGLLAAPALAQTDTPAPQPPATPVPAEPQAPTPPKPPSAAEAARARQEAMKVEQHIVELRRSLRITPAEQPQWDAFAQIMRDNAVHMEKLFSGRAEGDGMNAVEDLKSYADIAEAHAQDMRRLVPAFAALYAAMPPEQQKLADTAFKAFEARGMRRSPNG